MKKFFPRILIWNVTVYNKTDGFPLCNYYFLFKRSADKFFHGKYCERLSRECDVNISYGGEMLYLTAFDE